MLPQPFQNTNNNNKKTSPLPSAPGGEGEVLDDSDAAHLLIVRGLNRHRVKPGDGNLTRLPQAAADYLSWERANEKQSTHTTHVADNEVWPTP